MICPTGDYPICLTGHCPVCPIWEGKNGIGALEPCSVNAALIPDVNCNENLLKIVIPLCSCWLSLEGGLLYAFVGPAAAVVLVSLSLLYDS